MLHKKRFLGFVPLSFDDYFNSNWKGEVARFDTPVYKFIAARDTSLYDIFSPQQSRTPLEKTKHANAHLRTRCSRAEASLTWQRARGRRKRNAARYNGAPDKCRCASNKCREGRLLLTMSRKSGRLSTDTWASRGVGARVGHKEALQSQLVITQIQVSFYSATACPIWPSSTSVFQRNRIAPKYESALCHKKRRNRVRIESVTPEESFTKAHFAEEAKKRWNDILAGKKKVIKCWEKQYTAFAGDGFIIDITQIWFSTRSTIRELKQIFGIKIRIIQFGTRNYILLQSKKKKIFLRDINILWLWKYVIHFDWRWTVRRLHRSMFIHDHEYVNMRNSM